MTARVFRGLLRMIGGALAGMAIILLLVGWRLSSGPVSLAFLTPYIEKSLSSWHDRYDFEIDDTVLTWAGWERAVDVRVLGVKILDNGGSLLAAIPELSISLSVEAIVEGVVAPKTMEFFSPAFHIARKPDGNLRISLGEDRTDATMVAIRILKMLATESDREAPMSHLRRISIHDANLTITDEDLGSSWRAPDIQAEIVRTEVGVEGEIRGYIETGRGKTDLSALANYDLAAGRIDVGLSFTGLIPSRFAGLSDRPHALGGVELPLQGTVAVAALDDGTVESVGFDVLSTRGVVKLSGPVAETISIERVGIKGRYDGRSGNVAVDRLAIDLGDDGFIPMPEPSRRRFPARSLSLSAFYNGGEDKLEISDLKLDLRGPVGEANVSIRDAMGERPRVVGQATLRNVAVDQLAVYWPENVGRNARAWVTEHLSDGQVAETRADLDIVVDREMGSATVNRLSGTMRFRGATVDYLPPMPKVRDAAGVARFGDAKFSIHIRKGRSGALSVSDGAVLLTGLDTDNEQANIALRIDGPIPDAMRLIDHDPLRYAGKIGMNPDDAGGRASIRLKLRFPLLNDLELDRIDVSATASLKNVYIKDVFSHRDLSEGALELDVDKERINVRGDARLSRIPVYLVWTENFSDTSPFKSRYDVAARIAGVDDLNDLGLDLAPFRGDIVDGVVNAKIRYTVLDDHNSRVTGAAELGRVAISVPEIGWLKEKAQPGHAEMAVVLKDDSIIAVPKFLVETGALEIRGSATYKPNGSGIDKIVFEKVGFKKTDISGRIEARGDKGWGVSIKGKSLDLAPLWKEFLHRRAQRDPDAVDRWNSFSLDMAIDVDRVHLGEGRALEGVSGRLSREGDIWRAVVLKSAVGDGLAPLELRIEPEGRAARRLHVLADDAGLALKTLGIYDDMIGGALEIHGRFDDLEPDSPLDGRLKVDDFRVVNASVLARVVSIMSLTGILDALKGDGLGFIRADAPFRLEDGILELKEARSTGLALGWTASGTFDTSSEVLHLEGTLIPAYVINSVLGYIPILGDIFTGGEKGGGLFAAAYRVDGWIGEPNVTVDPLSALAPGFLRRMFQRSGRDAAPKPIASPEDSDGSAKKPLPVGKSFDETATSSEKPESSTPESPIPDKPETVGGSVRGP